VHRLHELKSVQESVAFPDDDGVLYDESMSMTSPRDVGASTVGRTDGSVDASRSATRVEALIRELRRLRVLARCLAATEVALVARIVVSGFSAVMVALVAALALLLLACVRLSVALSVGAAPMDATSRDASGAHVAHGGPLSPVSRRSVQRSGNGTWRRRRGN
jgi:hypothetical protein